MAYVVEITPAALRDASEYHQYILSQSHDQLAADQWLDGLEQATLSLAHLPMSRPRIPEQERFSVPYFQELYFSHRIIFRVKPRIVQVVRIYHSAARPLRRLQQRSMPKR